MITKDTPILITGATGFVGAYVVRLLLAQGYTQVHGLRRASSQMDLLPGVADAITWHEGSLEDYFSMEDALSGMEVVIHCAALVSFAPKDRQRLLQINREGTRHLVDAALHQGVRRLIYISSVAALGRGMETHTNEATKWVDDEHVSQYGRSKFFAELEVWRGQAEGLSVAVLYPSIILGAGRWASGSVKIFQYADGAPRYYPTGSSGFVDVRDVAQATLLTLERDEDEDRFLLNAGHLSYQSLLTQITTQLGHPAPTQLLPYRLALWLARIEKWRSRLTGNTPLLTRETVRTSYQDLRYDNRLSGEVLGITYRPLAQTVEETTAVYERTKDKGSGVF